MLGCLWLACAGADEIEPREIVLGVDVCERCHMIIDDANMAAQWVENDGTTHVFDEPGELVAWLEEGDRAAGVGFVADLAGAGWVDVYAASFVRGATRTFMGFGVVAFADRARADSLAFARGGVVLDWNALQAGGVSGAHTH